MRSFVRLVIFLTILLSVQSFADSAQEPGGSGAITGRVTLDGKPAQGVVVLAVPVTSGHSMALDQMVKPPVRIKAVTDSEGRYRFEGLPAGGYSLEPFAPNLVRSDSDDDDDKNDLNVADGATVEGIDFALSRGGVITGKITDSEGRPVIEEEIALKSADPTKYLNPPSGEDQRMLYTDDRGVYRIFGLRPGRYIVSAGVSRNPVAGLILKRPKRVETFYPGVTDEARAKSVELTAGAEASGIDIKLSAADKGFIVSGRITDAESGAPITSALIVYSRVREENSDKTREDSFAGAPGGVTPTNIKGEFRFDSVAPGRYKAEVQAIGLMGSGEFYVDPFNFEVQSANIEKLEVKAHRGASISGVLMVENSDGADNSDLAKLILIARLITPSQTSQNSASVSRVAADGSFRIGGLKPGKIKLGMVPYGEQRFSVVRIEHNGAELSAGIDIQANEQITGVRVIVAPTNCIIRGRVTIQGDSSSSTSEILVNVRPQNGSDTRAPQSVTADSKGNFVIENLAPGDYVVSATASLPGPAGGRRASGEQNVTVTRGTPAEVNLVLKLTERDK